jgi:hypothetical protein
MGHNCLHVSVRSPTWEEKEGDKKETLKEIRRLNVPELRDDGLRPKLKSSNVRSNSQKKPHKNNEQTNQT